MKPGKLIKFTLRAARRDGMERGQSITLDPTSPRARELLRDAGWDHVYVTGTVPRRPTPRGEIPAGGIAPEAAALHRAFVGLLKTHARAVAGLSQEARIQYATLLRDNRENVGALLDEACRPDLAPALEQDEAEPPANPEVLSAEELEAIAARQAEMAAEFAAGQAATEADAAAKAAAAPSDPVGALKAALAAPADHTKADLIDAAKAAGLPVPGTLAKLTKPDVVTALSELVAAAGV